MTVIKRKTFWYRILIIYLKNIKLILKLDLKTIKFEHATWWTKGKRTGTNLINSLNLHTQMSVVSYAVKFEKLHSYSNVGADDQNFLGTSQNFFRIFTETY